MCAIASLTLIRARLMIELTWKLLKKTNILTPIFHNCASWVFEVEFVLDVLKCHEVDV